VLYSIDCLSIPVTETMSPTNRRKKDTETAPDLKRGLIWLTLIIMGSQIASKWIGDSSDIPIKVLVSVQLESLPLTFLFDLLGYGVVFILLHALVAANSLVCRALLRLHGYLSRETVDLLTLIHFLSAWYLVFWANQQISNLSFFSAVLPDPASWLGRVFFLLTVACFLAVQIATLTVLLGRILQLHRTAPLMSSGLLAAAALVLLAGAMLHSGQAGSGTPARTLPNVILIGMDSVRYDVFDHPDLVGKVENIRAFHEQAATFTTAITPLARTYPSWMSLLTGLNPRESGIRINLQPPPERAIADSLAFDLKRKGYQTTLAIDERRFSNIDEKHGFDNIIGPQYGLADFVTTAVSDFPVVNLAANTRLGERGLPFVALNRAALYSYRPERFSARLDRHIRSVSKDKPMFLAVHFCLAHWPYTWAQSPHGEATDQQESSRLWDAYVRAVSAVDTQVGLLLEGLQLSGQLDNAIVVLFSDHGESFSRVDGQPELFRPDGLGAAASKSFGHGTSIVTPSENRIVLAFQRAGADSFSPGERSQLASTIDIRQTILDALGVDFAPREGDGISLLPWLNDSREAPFKRVLEMETGFVVPALESIDINLDQLISEGIAIYRLSNDGLLEVKEAATEEIIRYKDVAVTDGSSLVARIVGKGRQPKWLLADWERRTLVTIDPAAEVECPQPCQQLVAEVRGRFGTFK
jgi:arylsulfatase A-like enzyme